MILPRMKFHWRGLGTTTRVPTFKGVEGGTCVHPRALNACVMRWDVAGLSALTSVGTVKMTEPSFALVSSPPSCCSVIIQLCFFVLSFVLSLLRFFVFTRQEASEEKCREPTETHTSGANYQILTRFRCCW